MALTATIKVSRSHLIRMLIASADGFKSACRRFATPFYALIYERTEVRTYAASVSPSAASPSAYANYEETNCSTLPLSGLSSDSSTCRRPDTSCTLFFRYEEQDLSARMWVRVYHGISGIHNIRLSAQCLPQ